MARSRTRNQNFGEIVHKAPENEEKLLTGIEDEWLAARLRGEPEITERLLDEGYKGTTSGGVVQTKADFLRTVQASGSRFTDSQHSDRNVRVYGDTAVSTGIATLRSSNREHSFRYLRVFRKSGGEWRLVASQATHLRVG